MTAMKGDACADHDSVYISLNGEIDRANVTAIERQIRAAGSRRRPQVAARKLAAGLLSEAGLVGMTITSLQKLGREATILLAIIAVVLAVAISIDLLRHRMGGQR
jgi:hypothetical protein